MSLNAGLDRRPEREEEEDKGLVITNCKQEAAKKKNQHVKREKARLKSMVCQALSGSPDVGARLPSALRSCLRSPRPPHLGSGLRSPQPPRFGSPRVSPCLGFLRVPPCLRSPQVPLLGYLPLLSPITPTPGPDKTCCGSICGLPALKTLPLPIVSLHSIFKQASSDEPWLRISTSSTQPLRPFPGVGLLNPTNNINRK